MVNISSKVQYRIRLSWERGKKQQFFIIIFLLFLTIILSRNELMAFPYTEPTSTYFAQLLGHHPGEPGSALFVDNSYLYMGFQHDLVIFDATADTDPVLVASLFFHGHINEIIVDGNRAYILTSNGIHVLDVTNPEAAIKLGFLAIDDPSPSSIKIANQIAYILGYEGNGLYIIDVSDPLALVQIGFYDTTFSRAVIAIQDQTLFLLEGTYDNPGVQAFSVADPTHPQPIVGYSTPEDTIIIQATLTNGYLYLLTQTTEGCGIGGCTYASHLRVLATDTLVELTSITIPPASKMHIANNYIYFFLQDNSPIDALRVWELTTPFTAHEVSSQPIEGNVLNMVADVQNVYVSIEFFGLRRINIVNPTMPQLNGDYQSFNLKDIALGSDMTTLFALDTNEQFRIFDLVNPQQPVQLYSQQFYQSPYYNHTLALTLVNDLVYLLWFDDSMSRYTLDIIDVTTPENPIQVNRYPLQEPVTFNGDSYAQLQVIDDKVHIVIQMNSALEDDGYTIIDVANPAMPQQQDIWVSNDLLDFIILENHAMLRTRNGLRLLNIADPAQFVDLGVQLSDRQFTSGPVKYQNFLYFGEWTQNDITQVSVFDASNPADLIEVNQQDIEGVPNGMWVAADQLHISTSSINYPIQENGGFYLYTLNDPIAPDYAARLPVNGKPIRTGNIIYAAGSNGLDIVRLLTTVSEQYFPVVMKHFSQ